MSISENELAAQLEESQNEATPETESEVTPSEEETVVAQEPDPVQEYLAKYGGDTEAALKAAVEAQSLIGRQGQELGAIRQELQQFRQELTPQQEQYVPVDDNLVSWAQQIGYSDNAKDGAEWALNNQPAVYDEIMSAWYESDPKAAHRFEIGLATQAQQYQIMQQLAPQLTPLVAQSHQQQFVSAWNQLKPQFADIEQVAPQMLEVAQENPEMLTTLRSGTPEAQQRVIANLYWTAKGRAAAPLQTVANAAAQAAQTGAQQLRNQAAVGTATGAAPVTPPSAETPAMTEWRSALHEELGIQDES